MSKLIPLTKGYSAIVDDDDYDWLMQWKWRALATRANLTKYAIRHESITRKTLFMHREITKVKVWQFIDHVNRNGLDNRRSNLRTCNKSQNAANANYKKGRTSLFRGVSLFKETNKWRAQIRSGAKKTHLGYFDTQEEAAAAYDKAAIAAWGEFAMTNQRLLASPQVRAAMEGMDGK